MSTKGRPTSAIDTSQEMRLVQSPLMPALILLTAIILAAICVAMAVPLFPQAPTGKQQLYWLFGAIFFAVGAIAVFKQSFGENRPVLTLSPRGFHYNTVSAQVIPWSAVEDIGRWRQRRTLMIVAKVSEHIWETAGMTEAALKMRAGNKLVGIDGVAIATTGLPIRSSDLRNAFEAYWRAHRA